MEDQLLHADTIGTPTEQEEEKSFYDVIGFSSDNFPPQYKHLVYSRWLRSLRYGNSMFKKIKSDAYFKHYHTFIGRLLEMPDSEIRFAVMSDDHDIVLGFSVRRKNVLDYVHVHTCFRKQGIAKFLVNFDELTTFTHYTNDFGLLWIDKNKEKWKFDPFS